MVEFYPYESIQYIAASSAGAFISAYVLYNPGECVNGQCGVYTLELYDVDNGVNNVIFPGALGCATRGSAKVARTQRPNASLRHPHPAARS